jgi:pimeloyl-ACP methyl ester carboxylesterase
MTEPPAATRSRAPGTGQAGSARTAGLSEAAEDPDRRVQAGDPGQLKAPLTVIFHVSGQCPGPQMARHLAGLLPRAELHLVQSVAHCPKGDHPKMAVKAIGTR